MAVSVRLDGPTTRRLDEFARRNGISKSELLRRCLLEYLQRQQALVSPSELGKDLFGRAGSGRGDLSRNAERIVKEKVRAKRRGH